MTESRTIFSQAPTITALIRGLSVPRRLALRRRLHELIDATAERLISERGAAGARGECIRRMAFCARVAQGPRWTLWQQIHKRVRERTSYDDSKRVRMKDEIGVC